MTEQSVHRSVMSLREALSLPAFRHTAVEVLHGVDKLERSVRWVHVAESARAGLLLSGGELLLATGSGWSDDPADRHELLASFQAAGATALVLEIGQVWSRAPDDVIATCRALDLPLITTGSEIRFIEVTEQVHATLLRQQVSRTEAMQQVAEAFTSMTVEGVAPHQLILHGARLLGSPLVLEDPGHTVVYYAEGLEDPAELLADWHGRSRRWESALGHMGSLVEPVTLPNEQGWCVDIMARGTHWGRLVQIGPSSPPSGVPHVLRHTAMALAVERLGATRSYTWEDLLNRSILDRLTGSQFTATGDMTSVLNASGFRTRNRALVALEVRGPVTPATVRTIAAPTGWDVLAARSQEHPDRISAVISAPSGGDIFTALSAAAPWADVRTSADIAVLVSPVLHDVPELARALRTLERLPRPAPGITTTGTTAVSALMNSLSDDVQVRHFGDRLLEPLRVHDARHSTDLIQTVGAVVRHPTSRSAAAAELHLSRTSLYSRISTIERLLDADLALEDTQFALGLALRTMR